MPASAKRVTLGPMKRFGVVFFAAISLTACSRTAPDTKWPPPGPPGGLPYAPLPEAEDRSSETSAPPPVAKKEPTPIDAALASPGALGLARNHACKEKECKLARVLPDPAFGKAQPSGAESPGTFWLEELAPGSALSLPRHHALELLALTLEGKATATGDDGGSVTVEAWSALRAPGLGLTLKAGDSGAKLVLAVAVKSGTLAAELERLEKRPYEVRWKKRSTPMVGQSLTTAKDLSWAGGAFHVRIAFGGAEPALPGSLELLRTGPDAAIAEHDHPTWEHLAILSGAGKMTLSGKEYAVTPGAVFDIPTGEKHAFTPAGSQNLFAVQMYTPSGPEQRFVKLADEAAAAAAPAPKK